METYEQPIFPGLEAELISSPGAYHVSRLPLPGSNEAKKTTVGSGRQLSMLFDQSNPLGAFSKILLESSHWTNSAEFCYVWNLLDTKFGCSACQLIALGQSIEDSEFSLLPTPIRKDAEEGSGRGHHLDPEADMKAGIRLKEAVVRLWRTPNGSDATGGPMDGQRRLDQGHTLNLAEQAKTPMLWPTPHEADGLGGGRNPETWAKAKAESGGGCSNLRDAVKLWPTPNANESGPNGQFGLKAAAKLWPSPTAGDANASGSRNTPESNAHQGISLTDAARNDQGKGRLWPTPNAEEFEQTPETWLKRQARHAAKGIDLQKSLTVEAQLYAQFSGSLNPVFVEWLMGFPQNWTKSSNPGAPAKCRRRSPKSGFRIAHLDLGL